MHLLLIEGDRKTSSFVAQGFEERGHVCDVVEDGRGGLAQAVWGEYDVIIVDRMLPGLDGLSLVKSLRFARNATPLI